MGGVTLASPCTGICTVEDDRCVGCGRTLDEIVRWTTMGDVARDAVMARLIPDIPARYGEGDRREAVNRSR
ncbi:DUF1289 domain-containing protein [Sphingomonas sp.]|jgi:hypothetical protein|uniref:DUF1289 domain-containing protein n=1 Tax=Sphingomonas sp. TaxID=28214 RepID=UPI002EDB2E37